MILLYLTWVALGFTVMHFDRPLAVHLLMVMNSDQLLVVHLLMVMNI